MRKTIYVFATTLMLLLSSKLQAQCEEYNVSGSVTALRPTFGQSFTPSCSGLLDKFTVQFQAVTFSGNLYLMEGNAPQYWGTVLHTQPINIVCAGLYYVPITFTTPIPVIAGHQYTVVIESTDNTQIPFVYNMSNPYPSGSMWSFSSGTLFNTPSYDLKFAAHIAPANACTPTTSTTNQSICSSALPYTWNGLTFNAAGTQTAHLTNAGGCDSAATLDLTVISGLPAITGASAVCAGATTTLSNAVAGGVWFTQATSQATINPSTGLVTAKNAGTITVEYSKGACASVTKSLTINPIPSVPSITYAPGTTSNPQAGAPTGSFCVGKTFSVAGTPNVPAGAWTSTGVVGVTSGGVVTINAAGAGSIKYTYTNSNGCSNSRTMSGNGFTCAARGVNNNEQLAIGNEFSIYPNPARSFISLNVETLIGAGSIVVTDLYGKTVKTQPLSMGINTIDIANLTKGMYFVSTITSEGKTTKKLVVE